MCDTGYLAWFLMAPLLLATETCSVKDSESKKLGEFLLEDNCYIVISIVKN